MINLFWTGGWDSTYRLCELVLVRKVPVQPIYFIHQQRKSLEKEQQAMQIIRNMLEQKSADARKLTGIVKTVPVERIPVAENITAKYKSLKQKHGRLGIQYDWIARYAHETGLEDIELCICKSDMPYNTIWDMLEEYIVVDGSGNYRLDNILKNDDLDIFLPFRFPVINLSKFEMYKISKQYCFNDIMMKTWFCLTPRGNSPCGTCNPCRGVISSGIQFRMPVGGKFNYFKRRFENIKSALVTTDIRKK